MLFGKRLKGVLITIAALMALASFGIDSTALAVFSSALGVGLGFGQQKIIYNIISDIILLMDNQSNLAM